MRTLPHDWERRTKSVRAELVRNCRTKSRHGSWISIFSGVRGNGELDMEPRRHCFLYCCTRANDPWESNGDFPRRSRQGHGGLNRQYGSTEINYDEKTFYLTDAPCARRAFFWPKNEFCG